MERWRSWRLSIAAKSNAQGRAFDSWAILAWLQNEPASDNVESFLADTTYEASWSSINAGEVYYQLVRRQGQEIAGGFWRDVLSSRIPIRLYSVTDARVRRAALLKARFPIANADAFAMALALELKQSLVTGDVEIRGAAEKAGITLYWLGPAPSH